MADDDSQEKTEEASGRKIEKAREEGQVPRSRDLTTSVVLLVGSIGLLYFSDFMGEKYVEMTRENFILSRETIFEPNGRFKKNVFDEISHRIAQGDSKGNDYYWRNCYVAETLFTTYVSHE